MLVFADGSSNGRTAEVIHGKEYVEQTAPVSGQIVELWDVAIVFQLLVNDSFNLYTDSHYVFKAQMIKTIKFIGTSNAQVRILFQQIQNAIRVRRLSYFVGHISAYSKLPTDWRERSSG